MTSEPSTAPPATEPPATAAPATEPPATAAPATEYPTTEHPAAAGPAHPATAAVPTPPSPVEAVDRALRVVEALAAAGPRGRTLAELSGELDIPKPTLHRTLAALRHRHFAAQEPDGGRYVLGPAAVALGAAWDDDAHLADALRPALAAVSRSTDELVHLGVLRGTSVVYLDKLEPDRAIRVWSQVGRRMPALTTALGRALLGARQVSRDELAAWGDAATDQAWHAVERARARGWASEQQENEPGIACVAVAVLRGTTPVAAISVTAPAERMTPDRVESLGRELRTMLPPLLPAGLALAPVDAAD